MGTAAHNKTRYAAFISYAHADEAIAARLHKALETYPVPKHLRAQGKTTKPVFRDVAELTAAHSLSEKIRDAVKSSRVLIVLCSPAAKASHWVNEEIRLFREIHGDAAILSAIIDGTPATAFPDALIEGGREPLAAALGTDKAGFKLGVTQLAAGMLGTGLDELVQRGAKRRQRIMGAGLAASIALSGVMGFTTLQAVEARKQAEVSRADAEGLVEYMIKDLKFKLEPVGRLDLLEGIGDKAVEYYDKQDIKTLPDDSLTRQAAARQVLAQVALDAGRLEDAQREIEASADLTREVLSRNPKDTDAIFAHAQSEYWVADYFRRQGNHAEMEQPLREYDRLAQILYKTDPANFDWVMEAAWGQSNLGIWSRRSNLQKLASNASEYFTKSIDYFEQAMKLKPNSKLAQTELADTMGGNAAILLVFENKQLAHNAMLEYLDFQKRLAVEYPNDIHIKSDLLVAETDYYNGYFLLIGENEKKKLNIALDELFSLTEYDPNNLTYKKYFLDAVYNMFRVLDIEELSKRKKQTLELSKALTKDSGFNVEYYKSMNLLFEIKIELFQGREDSAREKLDKLNNIYMNQNDNQTYDWKLIFNLFLQNKEMGNKDAEIKFSRIFLSEVDDRLNLEFPTILFRKIQAFFTLKDCKNILPLVQNLETRGYNVIKSNLDFKSCEIH